MPPTNTDRIDDLTKLLHSLVATVDATRQQVDRLEDLLNRQAAAIEEIKVRLALAERDISELKNVRDEWGRRTWALIVPIITAIVGGVVGYLVKR
jgi:chromosome segregation ATPase